jgi:hypothetical protein
MELMRPLFEVDYFRGTIIFELHALSGCRVDISGQIGSSNQV